MKIYPQLYRDYLDGTLQTPALCWLIEKRNGQFVRGTLLDDDLEIDAETTSLDYLNGIYLAKAGFSGSELRSKSDLSVDNMSVEGALDTGLQIDISVADCESGVMDNAAVTLFIVNWQAPNDYQDVIERGYLGEIARTAEGAYRTEIRGPEQRLQQNVGATCGETCDVKRFGDTRCTIDVEALKVDGEIDTVFSRRRIDTSLDLGVLDPDLIYFDGGEIAFVTGANVGFPLRIKYGAVDAVQGKLSLWDLLPNDPQVGDTFTLKPGCNRTFERCEFWENTKNFRGHGRWIPGIPKIIRAP